MRFMNVDISGMLIPEALDVVSNAIKMREIDVGMYREALVDVYSELYKSSKRANQQAVKVI